MTKRELVKWTLDYTMPRIIANFEAIPDELVCVRPRPNINAPGWIFGHIAVTERLHVGRFVEGVDDIAKAFRIFRAPRPSAEDVRGAVESKEALVAYWREVRAKTRGPGEDRGISRRHHRRRPGQGPRTRPSAPRRQPRQPDSRMVHHDHSASERARRGAPLDTEAHRARRDRLTHGVKRRRNYQRWTLTHF